jgi:hypothetical protein
MMGKKGLVDGRAIEAFVLENEVVKVRCPAARVSDDEERGLFHPGSLDAASVIGPFDERQGRIHDPEEYEDRQPSATGTIHIKTISPKHAEQGGEVHPCNCWKKLESAVFQTGLSEIRHLHHEISGVLMV